jgi:hypothetical protein
VATTASVDADVEDNGKILFGIAEYEYAYALG